MLKQDDAPKNTLESTEAMINFIVANETMKASIEDKPDALGSITDAIDIQKLLQVTKSLKDVSKSVVDIGKNSADINSKSMLKEAKGKSRFTEASKYLPGNISNTSAQTIKTNTINIIDSNKKYEYDGYGQQKKQKRIDTAIYNDAHARRKRELEAWRDDENFADKSLLRGFSNSYKNNNAYLAFLLSNPEIGNKTYPAYSGSQGVLSGGVSNNKLVSNEINNTISNINESGYYKQLISDLIQYKKDFYKTINETDSKYLSYRIAEAEKELNDYTKDHYYDESGKNYTQKKYEKEFNEKIHNQKQKMYENLFNDDYFNNLDKLDNINKIKQRFKTKRNNKIGSYYSSNFERKDFIGYGSQALDMLGVGSKLGKVFGGLNPAILSFQAGADLLIKGGRKLFEAAEVGLQAFGEIQSIQTNLGVVYGNQSEANLMFNDLSQYATKSPFSVEQVSNFAVLLKQSGVYSSDLLSTLKMIGDTAGGNEEKMKRIANNYAQIVAMGKANAIDLRQFANAGIPIFEELRKQMGNISQKELRAKSTRGEITADIIEAAFKNMTSPGGRFYNAVEKGAETYKARTVNLKDIKQLSNAAWGERVYSFGQLGNNRSLKQFQMDFIESWHKMWKDIWTTANIDNRLGVSKADAKDYQELTGVLDALTKNTEVTEKNSIAIDALSERVKLQYSNYIDKARATGTEDYLNRYESYLNKKDTLENNLKIIESIGKTGWTKDVYNSTYVKDLLSSDDVLKSWNDRYDFDEVIQAYKDALLSVNKELDYGNKSQSGKYFIQTYGIQAARNAAEMFGNYSKRKGSSSSIGADIYEYYKGTDAYKQEQEIIKQNKIKEAKRLLEVQERAGLEDYSLNWLTNKNNKGIKLGTISNILTHFYGNTQLDLASNHINKETRDILTGNFNNIREVAGNYLKGDELKQFQNFEKQISLQLARDYSKMNQGELNKSNEVINEVSGNMLKWIEGLQDESKKIFLKALFIDPQANLIDEKHIQEAEKGNEKIITDFWKRYSSSVLGISIEGIDKGYSVTSQFKNLSARNANQSISKAMLSTGMRAEDVLNNAILTKYRTGRAGAEQSIGVNQEATYKKLEEIAMSSSSSAEVTQAYLNELQSQEDKLIEFFSGAAYKPEDMDKLYDPEWASALGYTDKESYVNAFNVALQKGSDGLKEFQSATMKAISAELENIRVKQQEARIISNLKNSSKEFRSEANSLEGNTLLSYYKNIAPTGYLANIKNGSYREKILEAIVNATKDKNGQIDIERARNMLSAITEGSYTTKGEKQLSELISKNGNKTARDYTLAEKRDELLSKVPKDSSLQYARNALVDFNKNGKDSAGWKRYSANGSNKNKTLEDYQKYLEQQVKNAEVQYLNGKSDYQQLLNTEKEIADLTEQANAERTAINDIIDSGNQAYLAYLKNKNIPMLNSASLPAQGNWFIGGHNESAYEGFSGKNEVLSTIVPASLVPERYGRGSLSNTRAQQVGLNYLDKLNGGSGSYEGLMSDFIKSMGTINTNSEGKQILTATEDANKSLINFLQTAKDAGVEVDGIRTSIDTWDVAKLDKAVQSFGAMGESAEFCVQQITEMGESVKNTFKSGILSGIDQTWKKIGEGIAGSGDASKDLAKAWKDVAANMLSSISSAMTNAGLNIAAAGAAEAAGGNKSGWGKVAAGLALAAAGGVAGISAGILSYEEDDNDSSNKENQEAERIQNLKDALSDLIDQAKTDAEYYQKNLLHKQALSANESLSGRTISVNDAIITPNGNVISTAPDDYLIATKTPDTLVNNNNNNTTGDVNIEFNPTIKVINQTSKEVDAEVTQSTDEYGNVEFDVIIKSTVAEAIANGDMDSAFAQRDYRINGKSVAW